MKTRAGALRLIVAALLLLAGCGYHNPYSKRVAPATPVATVCLEVWENRTNELGLESLLFQKTADWLQQSRHIAITANKEEADYLLSGEILMVDYPATAFSVFDVATTLQARVKVSYRLTDRARGLTIWETGETLRESSYPAGADAVRRQSNKKTALTSIANEVAEQVYLRVTTTLLSDRGQ